MFSCTRGSWLLLCLSFAPTFAAAPASLAGFVFVESRHDMARIHSQRGIHLQPGGTFRVLFNAATAAGGPTLENRALPNGGIWRYERVDETHGRLILTVIVGRPVFLETLSLTFATDFAGTIDLSGSYVGRTFRCGPLVAAPLANCSNRGQVASAPAAVTGFVIAGSSSRTVLVRAIGPGLQAFGVSDALPDPMLRILHNNIPVAANGDAGESAQRTGELVGAFPLPANTKDAAVVVDLWPGAYTAEATSTTSGGSGQVLIEVYMLP